MFVTYWKNISIKKWPSLTKKNCETFSGEEKCFIGPASGGNLIQETKSSMSAKYLNPNRYKPYELVLYWLRNEFIGSI